MDFTADVGSPSTLSMDSVLQFKTELKAVNKYTAVWLAIMYFDHVSPNRLRSFRLVSTLLARRRGPGPGKARLYLIGADYLYDLAADLDAR
jgi:hypothetical protein